MAFVLDLGFDEFPELFKPNQLVIVHGDAEMADNALANLAAGPYRLDELDGAARAVGGCLDAQEHDGGKDSGPRRGCLRLYPARHYTGEMTMRLCKWLQMWGLF